MHHERMSNLILLSTSKEAKGAVIYEPAQIYTHSTQIYVCKQQRQKKVNESRDLDDSDSIRSLEYSWIWYNNERDEG